MPRVHQAPGGESHRGLFLNAVGHRSPASQNPTKFSHREEAGKPLKSRGFGAIRTVFYPLGWEKSRSFFAGNIEHHCATPKRACQHKLKRLDDSDFGEVWKVAFRLDVNLNANFGLLNLDIAICRV